MNSTLKREKLLRILNHIAEQEEMIRLLDLPGYYKFIEVAKRCKSHINTFTEKDIDDLTPFFEKSVKDFEKKDIKKDKIEEGLVKPPISGQMSILELKKFRPFSKKEILVPKKISDISKKFNIAQLKKSDYIGRVETKEYGKMEKWQPKDIGYLVKTNDFIEKMEKQLPKVSANLDKVLKILIYLIQKEANKTGEDITKAKGSFYIEEIAKYMGYEEEIKLSGYVYKELKRTLISGACIVYEYPHKINGVNYKFYGSWWDLEVPEDNRHKWYYEFRGPYEEEIIKFVNTSRVQYLKHQLKEIADTYTGKKSYLHYFYNQMIYSNLSKNTRKIKDILKDMGMPDKILIRPKECFKILKDCLIYFYPEEIEGFYISKYYHKPKTGLRDRILINISEAFKNYDYEDFKEFLEAKGIKDIREAYIRLKKPFKPKYIKFELNEKDKELIKKIMEEAREWEEIYNKIPFNEDQRYKFLTDCIRYLGHIKLSDLFSNANNMMEFLTKTLRGKLKENKEEKLKLSKKAIVNK